MRSPALRWLVLGWAVFWFVVYVPGHQRGRVLMPGAERYLERGAGGCCESSPPIDKAASCDTKPSGRTPLERVKHCAVCFVAAGTRSAPTVVFHPPPMWLLGELCPPTLTALHAQASLDRAQARGPPHAAGV